MNQSLEAVQASAAHVRLEPDSEVAKRNSVFYLRQPGVTKKDFFPKQASGLSLFLATLEWSQTTADFKKFFQNLKWRAQNFAIHSVQYILCPPPSPLQDMLAEVEKREADLKMLQLYKEATGHGSDSAGKDQEKEESDDLNAKLVSLPIWISIWISISNGVFSIDDHYLLYVVKGRRCYS